MAINPETLKALREGRRLSQQDLADKAQVSKRQISRIESGIKKGKVHSEKPRRHTVASLAKALEVEPDLLCGPPTDDAVREAIRREADFRRVSVHLDRDTRTNFWLASHHYNVSTEDLINAAPWMFALLAEMSFADRRRRLDEFSTAFKAAMERVPAHLRQAHAANSDIDEACSDEEESLLERDLFGERVLATDSSGPDPFDPYETNPFVELLHRTAKDVGSDAIDPQDLMLLWRGEMPRWSIFRSWLAQITGGDEWARFALVDCGVSLADMPAELMGVEKTDERIAWMVGRIPSKARELEERQQRAELDAL